MAITIAILRAAGLTAAQILRVVELEESERRATKREQNRKNQQKQRARQQISADSADTADTLSFLEESKKEILPKKERKGVRGKPTLIPLPDDWQPKGPQRDPTEADEFRDKARAKGWVYANWDAAYRNYQKHPEFNHRNKNGGQQAPVPAMTDDERRALIEQDRLRRIREADNGKAQETTIRRGSSVGANGAGNAAELRLEGGTLHGECEQDGKVVNLLSAVAASTRGR